MFYQLKSSKSKYFPLIKHCASGYYLLSYKNNKIEKQDNFNFDLNFVLRYSI